MKRMRMSFTCGMLVALACLIASTAVVGQRWAVTAAAPFQALKLPAVAWMSVSVNNTSAGFAWVILARTGGKPLGCRIDPASSMTFYGTFASVVMLYHVPTGSPARPANGNWTIVAAPVPGAVLEPAGTWYVDSAVNATATIYVCDTAPPPGVRITITNRGPRAVRVMIRTFAGAVVRIPLAPAAVVALPLGVPALAGATISEVIVEYVMPPGGARSTGLYTVSM